MSAGSRAEYALILELLVKHTMQLTVPQRTVADTESFPVEPDGVSRWLAKLNPTRSTNDAMEVYRGLRHSNRLHNDLNRRRAVVSCFIPTLRELNESLLEICQAQPLPLTADFQRTAQLLDSFLREEAFAFKILLADSPQPRGDDVRRAMQALARQAECRIHGCKSISESLLQDAHQLYGLAEEFSLLDAKPGNNQRSTAEHYKYILLLTLADCRQHQVRQLSPLLEFLQNNASTLRILTKAPSDNLLSIHYAVHLQYGTRPVPAPSLVVDSYRQVRWFNLANLLKRIDVQLAKSNSQDVALLGSESLDRQSLARLRVSLANSRQRRSQRVIRHEQQIVTLGHKSICAHLHFGAAKSISSVAENAENTENTEEIATSDRDDVFNNHEDQNWVVINQSAQGAALYSPECRAGVVQVGELVSIETTNSIAATSTVNGKSTALIGVVRWVIANDNSAIRFGVEYLAKGVLPVGISRTHSDDIVADDAMIIACKVKDIVLQTILLPAYLYEPGDRLTVTLRGKARSVVLNKSLQNNGLFSHFSLRDE